MKIFRSTDEHTVGSTTRIEAYTDAVIAIIITLLVLELHIPELADTSIAGVFDALQKIFHSSQVLHLAFFRFLCSG